MVRPLPIWLCAAAVLSSSAAWAQSVRVELSATQLDQDEELQVTFVFSGSGTPNVPDLSKDWTIVGQSSGISRRIVFGGPSTRSDNRTFVLVPKRAGKLIIGTATMVRGARVVARTNPRTITVVGVDPVLPSQARLSKNLPQERVLMVPELERDVFYAGEPFVVAYTMYLLKDMGRIHQPEVGDLVAPEGVERANVLGKLQFEQKTATVHGRTYRRLVVLREVWTILRPTRFQIPSVKGKIYTSVGRFGVKSKPITIEIRGEPTIGRPDGYRAGSIGRFQLGAKITPYRKDTRAVLEVTLSGRGSLETLVAPDVSAVTGATLEEMQSDEKDVITATAEGMVGKRVFQWLVTPDKAGTLFVPELKYHYLDPEKGTFEITRSSPVTFRAKLDKKKKPVARSRAAAARGIHSIVYESDLATGQAPPVHAEPWFLITLATFLCGFLGLEVWAVADRRRQAGSGATQAKRAHRRALKAMAAARAGSPDLFYGALAQAIKSYALSRCGLSVTGLTSAQIRSSLAERAVPAEAIEGLVSELENCDFARFAPGSASDDSRDEALTRTKAVLSQLEAHYG